MPGVAHAASAYLKGIQQASNADQRGRSCGFSGIGRERAADLYEVLLYGEFSYYFRFGAFCLAEYNDFSVFYANNRFYGQYTAHKCNAF